MKPIKLVLVQCFIAALLIIFVWYFPIVVQWTFGQCPVCRGESFWHQSGEERENPCRRLPGCDRTYQVRTL